MVRNSQAGTEKQLKTDALPQTNRVPSAVITKGNLVLSKNEFRLDYHSVLASVLVVHVILLLNRQPSSSASQGTSELFLS